MSNSLDPNQEFCQSGSVSKLFTKVISRWQMSLLLFRKKFKQTIFICKSFSYYIYLIEAVTKSLTILKNCGARKGIWFLPNALTPWLIAWLSDKISKPILICFYNNNWINFQRLTFYLYREGFPGLGMLSVLVVQSEQHVIYRLMAGEGQGGPN